MLDIDVSAHNAEQAAVWAAYRAGKPTRVPIQFTMNPRMILLDPSLNRRGLTFQDYISDPQLMLDVQLEFQYWRRHNVVCDLELGVPEREWEAFYPDWQNYQEAGWFGCPVTAPNGAMPRNVPLLQERKELLYDWQLPRDLLRGHMPAVYEFYLFGVERAPKVNFHGRPMAPPRPWFLNPNQPWTTACDIRGTTEVCLDIHEDPDYVHALMAFIADATIARARAWRKDCGLPAAADPAEAYPMADDSIALLSPAAYREFVLPYHRRILQAMGSPRNTTWHLCGRARHHFATLVAELGAVSFDVGSCTDLAEARRALGPSIQFLGNIDVTLLLQGGKEEIAAEVRRTMGSGIMEGGRYIMREGSNVAPRTPPENLRAMYEAGKEAGAYRA